MPAKYNAKLDDVICSTCHEEKLPELSLRHASCFKCKNILTLHNKICVSLPQDIDLSRRYYCIKFSKILRKNLDFERLKKITPIQHFLSSITKTLPSSDIKFNNLSSHNDNYDSNTIVAPNSSNSSLYQSSTTSIILL